jgi:uncharacterized membrane protein
MKKIREFFWPLLEKSIVKKILPLEVNEISVKDENIQKALDYSMKIYESELGRNTTIETKASLFIGTLAIITSIALGITTTLIGQNGFSTVLFLLVHVLFFLIIYGLRTVWFSVKVHERQSFNTFYHDDILKNGNEIEYSKQLISSIVTKTRMNSIIINSKIDNMVMAQEYFMRVIITLLIYSILLIVFFIDKCKLGIRDSITKVVRLLNEVDFGTGFILLIVLIAILSIVINFILLKKLR